MRNIYLLAVATTLAATPAAAADLKLSDAWVRLPAVEGRPAAGYLMVTGGATPPTIRGASSPSAARAQLHGSRYAGGLLKMSQIPKPSVARGQSGMFKTN